MNTQNHSTFVTLLQQLVAESPPAKNCGQGCKNIGALLEYSFSDAGYNLELHQKGIAGTDIIVQPKLWIYEINSKLSQAANNMTLETTTQTTERQELPPLRTSAVLGRLRAHIAQMAEHQKTKDAGKLIIESERTISALDALLLECEKRTSPKLQPEAQLK